MRLVTYFSNTIFIISFIYPLIKYLLLFYYYIELRTRASGKALVLSDKSTENILSLPLINRKMGTWKGEVTSQCQCWSWKRACISGSQRYELPLILIIFKADQLHGASQHYFMDIAIIGVPQGH